MTKEESVLYVLLYLFNYHMNGDCKLDKIEKDTLSQLEEIGFSRRAIVHALGWLANLTEVESQEQEANLLKSASIRVFSEQECEVLDTDCRGFILGMEQRGILSPITREIVIAQAMDLANEAIDLGLMKWVTLMVLFNQPEEDQAMACMEYLVLQEDAVGGVH